VSDYALELLGELGKKATVRVLTPPEGVDSEPWTFGDGVEVVPTDTVPEPDEVVLLHLGNNPHHQWLLDRLDTPKPVVVLHDLVLHHLLVEATKGDDREMESALRGAHGDGGAALARARRCGFTAARDPFLFPARAVFLGSSRGFIVHSRWAEEALVREYPDVPTARVGLAVADPGKVVKSAERGRLGIAPDEVVLMHLGFLTPEKGLHQILTGVLAARRLGVPVRLLVVGEGAVVDDLRSAAAVLGLEGLVSTTGWVEPEAFPAVPAAADLGVVLRTPSAGETSAAAVRFLAAGTPVAVGGSRQFLEWPEAAAPRLTPGPAAPAELARLLATAWKNGEAWRTRGHAARAAYDAEHRPAEAAEAIVRFLESL
jgi:glycosyltransferase involved in cell wall biosynthesis